MTTITREMALEHLYANSLVDEATGCREWQGSRNKDGYGQLGNQAIFETFRIKGTHRLMYQCVTGHEYAGRHEQILHSCDNPACLEPRHLSLGSARDNMLDCIAKGRRNFIYGERVSTAKVTVEEVKLIKALLAQKIKGRKIAELFGITANIVSQIKTGKSWRSV